MKAMTHFVSTYRVPTFALFGSLLAIGLVAERSCSGELYWDCTFGNLEKWQTAIGAVLGLTALLFGALYNAELNRRRDDRLQTKRAYALATGLAVEIDLQQTMIRNRTNVIMHCVKTNKIMTAGQVRRLGMPPPTPIYDNNTGDLGLLDTHLCIKVANSYRRLNEHFRTIEFAAANNPNDGDRVLPNEFIGFGDANYDACNQAIGVTIDLFKYAKRSEAADDAQKKYDYYLKKPNADSEISEKIHDDARKKYHDSMAQPDAAAKAAEPPKTKSD